MTIEKCIDEIKELELPFYLEPKRKEILQVVEELRNESLIYRKALDMACEQLWDDFSDCDNCPVRNDIDKCNSGYCGVTSYDLMNYFLKEASE